MRDSYFERAIRVLENPQELWSIAFLSHLSELSQLLLLALSSLPPQTEYEDLRIGWGSLADERGIPRPPGSYDRNLRTLEGSFLTILAADDARFVRFANPSVADFMLSFLDDEPDVVGSVIRSSRFFFQVEHLWNLGMTGRPSIIANDPKPKVGVQRALGLLSQEFPAAIRRTFQSPELVHGWSLLQPGVRYRPQPEIESRLIFVLRLPPTIRPPDSWLSAQFESLAVSWACGEGSKSTAVKLIEMVDKERPLILPGPILNRCRMALGMWLRDNPEEMDDWAPLLEFAAAMGARERSEVVDGFTVFVREELERWDPVPPDFDELKRYAERFGVSDLLVEEFDLANEREETADKEASSDTQKAAPLTASGSQADGSDSTIDLLFASMVARVTPPPSGR